MKTKFCLWGSNWRYVQIGSPEDIAITRRRRAAARQAQTYAKQLGLMGIQMRHLSAGMGIGLLPAAKQLAVSLRLINRSLKRYHRRQRGQWPLWADYVYIDTQGRTVTQKIQKYDEPFEAKWNTTYRKSKQ